MKRSPGDLARFAVRSDEWLVAARDRIVEELRHYGHRMAEDAAQYAALRALQMRRSVEAIPPEGATRITALKALNLRKPVDLADLPDDRDPFDYLLTVARNQLRDRWRRERRLEPFPPDPSPLAVDPADAPAALDSRETCEVVRDALARLPEVYRRVILLRHVELTKPSGKRPSNEEVGLALRREELLEEGSPGALGQRARRLLIKAESTFRGLIEQRSSGTAGAGPPSSPGGPSSVRQAG